VPKDDQQTSSRAAFVDEQEKKCKLIAKRKTQENNNHWPANVTNPPTFNLSITADSSAKATRSR
jgi:hypothetical protein